MKVVVDEGVPRHLVLALVERGLDASRFPRNWTLLSNGALVRAVEAAGFDVLVTNDKNMAEQQNLSGFRLAIVALPHNRRRPIVERADDIEDTVRRAEPGTHVVVHLDGTRTMRRVRAGEIAIEHLPPVAAFTR